jgi:tryptophan halogenase
MTPKIRKIVIVGGGTAGWMTAASFAKLAAGSGHEIEVVESEEIGIVGVGEATIPPLTDFNRSLQIDEAELMKATQASYKLGIEFVDWYKPGSSYIHPFGHYGVQMHGIFFHHFWLRHRAQGGTMPDHAFNMHVNACRENRFGHLDPKDRLPLPPMAYAYHFDASLYALFLRRMAEKLGVVRTEGRVVDVQQRATDGFIESIKLADGRVVAGDFFIDCSGFRGLLIEQTLKAGYEDWSEWLPCNRAVAVPCDRVAVTTPYTRSTSREAGWQWRIPLQHRTGNGYVYCSEFLSEDEASAKLLSRLDGTPRATPRPLKFVTGRRKKVWDKNCVAVGLASGFLEPLESTSIHLIQSAISKLMFMFPRDQVDPATVEKYNALALAELQEIRDVLVLHYSATLRDDTPFWRHCRAIRRPESLQLKWEMYERSGGIITVPSDLFKDASWFAIFTGQGVIPRSWHPFADIPSDEELQRRFVLIAGDVRKRLDSFPSHDEYLRMYRQAPPMGEAMGKGT